MGFWKKVETEIEFRGMTRKELSALSGVPMTTMNRAMERDSSPFAYDALRIAIALELPLGFLLDLPERLSSKDAETVQKEIHLYRKYRDLIENCEQLSTDKLKLLIAIAKNFEKN